MYVDVHCHLDDSVFADIPALLERCTKAGIKAIISNGTGLASNMQVQALAAKYPLIRPAYGLYPTEASDDDVSALQWIRDQALSKCPAVAIGEIGLDGVNPVTAKQLERFRSACQLAEELRLPVIVHSRKAEQQVLDELKAFPGAVVLHCFGGSRKLIEEAASRRYYFSVPATIAKATHFQMLVELVPLSQLLTETDSPYLSPDKQVFPNEPVNVVNAVEHISRIKGITAEECSQALFMNYQRVFS